VLERMAACSAAASSSKSRSTGCTCRTRHGDRRCWGRRSRTRHADGRHAHVRHDLQRPSRDDPLPTLPLPRCSDRPQTQADTASQPRPHPEQGAGRQATPAAKYEWFSQRVRLAQQAKPPSNEEPLSRSANSHCRGSHGGKVKGQAFAGNVVGSHARAVVRLTSIKPCREPLDPSTMGTSTVIASTTLVAKQPGIDEVVAEMLPEDKSRPVQ